MQFTTHLRTYHFRLPDGEWRERTFLFQHGYDLRRHARNTGELIEAGQQTRVLGVYIIHHRLRHILDLLVGQRHSSFLQRVADAVRQRRYASIVYVQLAVAAAKRPFQQFHHRLPVGVQRFFVLDLRPDNHFVAAGDVHHRDLSRNLSRQYASDLLHRRVLGKQHIHLRAAAEVDTVAWPALSRPSWPIRPQSRSARG